MKNPAKQIKIFTVILIIIEFFNGLSGLAGGYGLIADPSAANLGMELSWLEGTPFNTYLVPGIVLLAFNGLGNIIAAILSLKKSKYMNEVAVFFGFGMIIWIVSQVLWIGYKNFLQPLYFSTGLVQGILGLFIRNKMRVMVKRSS
ncbi:MAG: hypothetical protein JW866_09425 [Ignavibacteriales bacterium]|nr:hypothetical protein [Ignavibacteriales bacterium]